MAKQKFLQSGTSGEFLEAQGVDVSAGAGDSGKIVSLDTSGKIDSTMMPSELIQNNELLLNETDIASSQEQSEDENASFDQTISQSNFSRY